MKRRLAAAVACALLVVSTGVTSASSPCSATSGARMLPLVELFTSEGCDSCPPADRWLSSTFPDGDPAASVLAFHVDYWDRLGWKDRFASPGYTARQYAAMRANGETFVYTPQVLVQGRDVVAARRSAAVQSAGTRPAGAAIALDADGRNVRLRATVPDRALRRNAAAWIAYTENGLVSDVQAGENRGVQLRHDHVVRALFGPFAIGDGGEAATTIEVVPPAERGRHPALVAFVQNRASGEVLQTLTLRCGE